jgi:hypothetical protein
MSHWIGMGVAPRAPRPELKALVLGRALAARRGPRAWALAVAAVLALALAGSGLLWRRVSRLEGRLAATHDTLDLLRQPGTRVISIPVVVGSRTGGLTIFVDSTSHRWLVTCHHLAPNAAGQAYQLWFVTERGMRTAAVMPMDEDTPMVVALELPRGTGKVIGVAMSVEVRQGSAQPKGPMLFHVDL